MKMNFKENKGITLVALIITTIVLLILAVVTISAVKEGDLFTHAENAANKYKNEANLENSTIAGYLEKMKKYSGKELNEYGFYYDTPYISHTSGGSIQGTWTMTIQENGDIIVTTYELWNESEGASRNFEGDAGIINSYVIQMNPIEYNKEYTGGPGPLGMNWTVIIDSDGNLHSTGTLANGGYTLATKSIIVEIMGSPTQVVTFSEDGKSLTFGTDTYTIE